MLSTIGDRVPGFGGLYIDSTGIVVFLTNPAAQQVGSDEAIHSILAQAEAAGQMDLARVANAPIRFRQGNHTFSQLREWQRELYRRQIPQGTVTVGIDKMTNQLLVGVSRQEARIAWGRMISAARIPDTGIRIEEMEIPLPNVTLQDQVRPTAGGLQIIRQGDLTNATCTLGANVVLPYYDPGALFFLTASHCSQKMWGPDGGSQTWYQSLIDAGQEIAVGEEMDPEPVPNGGSPYPGGFPVNCPAGRVCRWSDATLIRYSDPSLGALGRVAVANAYPSTLTILQFKQYGNPRCFWDCPSTNPNKTGRTTGTTVASSNYYDQDYFPDSAAYTAVGVTIRSNWVMIGQTRLSNMVAAGGDSGSPVFLYDSYSDESNPRLMGIYHAGSNPYGPGNRIVSPIANVANDLAGSYFSMTTY